MDTNISVLCEETTNVEISILFWTLIVTMVSILITVIISIASNHQNAKLNSINLFKNSIGKSFEKFLLNDMCEKIADCKYRVVDETGETIKVSFDKVPLIKVQNKVSCFLGEVAFLKYAIPHRYSKLNKLGNRVIYFIDNIMIPCAIFENAPHKIPQNKNNILSIKSAEKKQRKLLKRIKRFYKMAFNIYKYGI